MYYITASSITNDSHGSSTWWSHVDMYAGINWSHSSMLRARRKLRPAQLQPATLWLTPGSTKLCSAHLAARRQRWICNCKREQQMDAISFCMGWVGSLKGWRESKPGISMYTTLTSITVFDYYTVNFSLLHSLQQVSKAAVHTFPEIQVLKLFKHLLQNILIFIAQTFCNMAIIISIIRLICCYCGLHLDSAAPDR